MGGVIKHDKIFNLQYNKGFNPFERLWTETSIIELAGISYEIDNKQHTYSF